MVFLLSHGMECRSLPSERGILRLTPFASSPKAILAKGGEAFVLLAGRPVDEGYVETLAQLEAAVAKAGEQFLFTSQPGQNRRGGYRAISTGVTLGGGSKVGPTQQTLARSDDGICRSLGHSGWGRSGMLRWLMACSDTVG